MKLNPTKFERSLGTCSVTSRAAESSTPEGGGVQFGGLGCLLRGLCNEKPFYRIKEHCLALFDTPWVQPEASKTHLGDKNGQKWSQN